MCRVKGGLNLGVDVVPQTEGKAVVDIIRWDRRDRGNVAFWQPMQIALEKYLSEWDYYLERKLYPWEDIDVLVSNFVSFTNKALCESLKIRQLRPIKTLNWSSEIYRAKVEEKAAFAESF